MAGIVSSHMTKPEEVSATYFPDTSHSHNTLLTLASLLLGARRLVAAMTIGMGVLVVGVTLLSAHRYTTTLSFTPVVSTDLPVSGIGGLAGQLGISIPGQDPSQTPEFYATLIQTPDILTKLAEKKYQFSDNGRSVSGSFISLYDLEKADTGRTLDGAIHELTSKVITVTYDRETSIIEVSVTTKWPALSYLMGSELLSLVNEFNLTRRQIQGEQELHFLTQRLDTARSELRSAENTLQDFVTRNRAYQSDPTLSFEHDRLQREVSLRQDVYSLMTQSVEQARMRAVRNTPSISLIQHPAPALRADRRHTLPKLLGAMFGGFIVAVAWVLGREAFLRGRSDYGPEFEVLERRWQDSVMDLRRLLPLRRHRDDR